MKTVRRFQTVILGLLFVGFSVVGAPSEFVQFFKDPSDPLKGWILSKKQLHLKEPGGPAAGELKLDEDTVAELLGAHYPYRFAKVYGSSSPGSPLFVIMEVFNYDGVQRQFMTLVGRRSATEWVTSLPKKSARVAEERQPSRTPPIAQVETKKLPPVEIRRVPTPSKKSARAVTSEKVEKSDPGRPSGNASEEEVVNLDDLDSGSSPTGSSQAAVETKGGHDFGAPELKFMFDFWLYTRSGITPLTFSNVHTLSMVDVVPNDKVQFSFELSPTARFYQVTFTPNPKWEMRLGRIFIPFDLLGPSFPHNLFGGFVNVSQFRQTGGTPFLPDIWTDLGIAGKYWFFNSGTFSLNTQLYLVNGFGAGTSDPKGEVGTLYPNFGSTPNTDNNTDKAIGGRVEAGFGNTLAVGGSFYTGRYSNDADQDRRILMLGLDAQIKSNLGIELKGGYTYMQVDLPTAASVPSMRRGGYYGEVLKRFGRRWKIFARGGASQNDSRSVSVDDLMMVGGGAIYSLGFVQVSLMYQRDLNQVTGKQSYEFGAMRAAIML